MVEYPVVKWQSPYRLYAFLVVLSRLSFVVMVQVENAATISPSYTHVELRRSLVRYMHMCSHGPQHDNVLGQIGHARSSVPRRVG